MHSQTVFIIDDDASVRDALMLLLSLKGHACAAFASAEDFLTAFDARWRGCVIADIRMPGISGLQLQARLREHSAELPVIVITAHGDVAAARQAFLADAVDFLEKPFDADVLLRAVEAALARLSDGSAAEAGSAGKGRPDLTPRPGETSLSPREHEVMGLLVKGLNNRRIADELGISHRTVELHKARVLGKLGVHSVIELVRWVDRRFD